MALAHVLQNYLKTIGCTARELSTITGISPSSLSRYLAGSRLPAAKSDMLERLADGLATLAESKGQPHPSAEELLEELRQSIPPAEFDFDRFTANLKQLMDLLGISNNALARALSFDPSYISRILAGTRRPANPRQFINSIADHIVFMYTTPTQIERIAQLAGRADADLLLPTERFSAITAYLGVSNPSPDPWQAGKFLEELDSFELNDRTKSLYFEGSQPKKDRAEILTAGSESQQPLKSYEGAAQMLQADLDFLDIAINSSATDDIILYSDMPIDSLGNNPALAKERIERFAAICRRGLKLRIVHNVYRPFAELMLGIENWAPLYMTGQIVSYYLPTPTNYTFLHLIRSAGSVCLRGEAIVGHQNETVCIISQRKSDVKYNRRHAEQILSYAQPLMHTYRDDSPSEMRELAATLKEYREQSGEDPIVVAEGAFRNLDIVVMPGRYALVSKRDQPVVHFLIEHPTLVDALAQYKPSAAE